MLFANAVGRARSFKGPAIRGVSVPPKLIALLDVANETYQLNGNPATMADILVNNQMTYTPNVGLSHRKLAGTSAGGAKFADFSPALFALCNVPGGFTAMLDYTFDDLAMGTGLAHPSLRVGLTYFDAAYAHDYSEAFAFWHNGGSHFYPTDLGLTVFKDDYGVVGDQYAGGDNNNAGSGVGPIGTVGLTFADATTAYYPVSGAAMSGDNRALGAPGFPSPYADKIALSCYAHSHQGLTADKLPVTGRATVRRMRVYTPAQPVGWAPTE